MLLRRSLRRSSGTVTARPTLTVARPIAASASLSTTSSRLNANTTNDGGPEPLLQQLKDELKNAMRAKDSNVAATIRNLLSEHQYAQKQQGGTPSSLLSILQKAIARRHEAASSYSSANRPDLAEKEKNEASYISKFLPQQLSAEEVRELVQQAVSAAKGQGVETKKLLGWIMKEVKGRVEGRTDVKKLKDVVEDVIKGGDK